MSNTWYEPYDFRDDPPEPVEPRQIDEQSHIRLVDETAVYVNGVPYATVHTGSGIITVIGAQASPEIEKKVAQEYATTGVKQEVTYKIHYSVVDQNSFKPILKINPGSNLAKNLTYKAKTA